MADILIQERLKEIRKALGLNQTDFSQRLGIKQSSYSSLESGKNTPSMDTVILLIEQFQVSPLWFFRGEGDIFIVNNDKKVGVKSGDTKGESEISLWDLMPNNQKVASDTDKFNDALNKEATRLLKEKIKKEIKEKYPNIYELKEGISSLLSVQLIIQDLFYNHFIKAYESYDIDHRNIKELSFSDCLSKVTNEYFNISEFEVILRSFSEFKKQIISELEKIGNPDEILGRI